MEDDEEFVAWVEAKQAGLLRFAYLMCADQHLAEDLVQTALAKAYLKWDGLTHPAARGAWVRRIIVHETTSSWRRPWRRHEVTSSPYVDHAALAIATDSTERFDAELWEVVRSLPPKQRAAVVLRYYEELTERETADVLGCSVGNVKSQTHRALATLRARLQEVHR